MKSLHDVLANEPTAAIAELATKLANLEGELRAVCREIEGSQSYLRGVVPRPLLEQQLVAIAHCDGPDALLGDGDAAAILADVRSYAQLEGVRDALARLSLNNRRFAMVLDLMSAAKHLLEPATGVLAHQIVGLHVAQCHEALQRVRLTLKSFPRTGWRSTGAN